MTIIKEPEAEVGMTLTELRAEVFAQGFDDFEGDTAKEAQINRWINTAYQEVCLFKDWPFLESEYEGTLPTTLANLGKVLDVVSVNSRYNLRPYDRRVLIRRDPTLEGTGNIAECWFKEGNGTIVVYPKATSENFRVRFTVVPEELTGVKKPIVPQRFQYAIVKGAQRWAYMSRDAYAAAELVEGIFNRALEQMTKQLLNTNHDMNRTVQFGSSWRTLRW
jgi:hypothetical protein